MMLLPLPLLLPLLLPRAAQHVPSRPSGKLLPPLALSPTRCPFCPAVRTTQIVGAAGGDVLKGPTGEANISATVMAAQAEGLNALGVDAKTCSQIEQLETALRMTDGSSPQFMLIAGLESHGNNYRQPPSSNSYCSLNSSGRVDWPKVTTTLAQLSLKHPQLLGYRMDDFMSGLASHAAGGVDENSCNVNSSACWSLADVAEFTSAGRRVNPKLRFLPVIYLQRLGAVHPNGFHFGAVYGPTLDAESAVTLVGSFSLAADAVTATAVTLSMFLASPFKVEITSGPYCKPGGAWYNTTFVQVAVNSKVLQENDLCRPVGGLDHAGQMALPQLFVRNIAAHVKQGQNELTVKVYGKSQMHGKNYQSVEVWDLKLIAATKKVVPVSVSFRNRTTSISRGWLFHSRNTDTTPLRSGIVDGVYACWQQSDPQWKTPQEQQLYKALLRSMRTALPANALLLTTHFGTTNWAVSHGGPSNSIRPQNEFGMMIADGPLADGVMIWWDQLGLSSALRQQRGIFAPGVSAEPARFPLATAFRRGDMPLGWFARYDYAHSTQPSSSYDEPEVFSIEMVEVTTHAPSSGRNFRKIVSVGGRVVYNSTAGRCTKLAEGGEGGWSFRPCPGYVIDNDNAAADDDDDRGSCTSMCAEVPRRGILRSTRSAAYDRPLAADFVETLVVKATTGFDSGRSVVSFGIYSAVDSDDEFAVMWNSSLSMARAIWKFESGIDPTLSQLVAVHAAVENATNTLLHCACD
jgi:hypothetical protein